MHQPFLQGPPLGTQYSHTEGVALSSFGAHGLGSLQSLSSQGKACLLYSAGISSVLVRQSSAESPLVPYHLLWWRTLLWKAVFLEGFCRYRGQCGEERPAAASGRGRLPVTSRHAEGTAIQSSPSCSWSWPGAGGSQQLCCTAVLHSCAGALSQPSGLLSLRKEGSPALLSST